MNIFLERLCVLFYFSSIWFIIHLYVPYLMIKIPNQIFFKVKGVFRTFAFEKNGNIYQEYFKIKKWKKYLPDGGKVMDGGFEKRSLKSRDPQYIKIFIVETYRAEATHVVILAHSFLFYLISDVWVFLIMFLTMSIIHIPCIIVQRYNRPRFEKMINFFDRTVETQTFTIVNESDGRCL